MAQHHDDFAECFVRKISDFHQTCESVDKRSVLVSIPSSWLSNPRVVESAIQSPVLQNSLIDLITQNRSAKNVLI